MRKLRGGLKRLLGMFTGSRRDRDFTDELETHLQLHIDDNLRAGMPPAEARRQALMRLGGVEQTKERYRDRRGLPFLADFIEDVRYSLRTMRRSPGFASVVLLTMALGIGANSAIFTVINAVLLRPLPYPRSEQLVSIVQFNERLGGPEFATWPEYNDWREQSTRFQGIGGAWQVAVNLSGIAEPERLNGAWVTGSLWSVPSNCIAT